MKITDIHYTVVPYSRQNAQTSIFETFCHPSNYAFLHNKVWCSLSPYYCLEQFIVQIKRINYYYMPHHQTYIELKSSNEGLELLCFEFVNYLFNLCCQKYYKSILDNCVCLFLLLDTLECLQGLYFLYKWLIFLKLYIQMERCGNGIKYQEIHLGRKARNNTPVKVKNITTMLVCQWNVNLKHR